MSSIEMLRTRGLPFSLMTTTHGLLVVADGEENNLFTYCPERGVMLGLGDFDDRPRMYTPKCLQLFDAPVEDLLRMKREWGAAVASGEQESPGTSLPFLPALGEPVFLDLHDANTIASLDSFVKVCSEIEAEESLPIELT